MMPGAGWVLDMLSHPKYRVEKGAAGRRHCGSGLLGWCLAKEHASKLNATNYVILILPMGKIPIVDRHPKT